MPGKKKNKKNKSTAKKQTVSAKNVNPTKLQEDDHTAANDPTLSKEKENLDDAIIVEEVIVSNELGNNNNTANGKVSPFEAFVSQFDANKESPAVFQSPHTKKNDERFVRDLSDIVNNNEAAVKNRNTPEMRLEKRQHKQVKDDMSIEDFLNLGVSPEIVMMKHPLANKWVFWWYRNDKSRSWEQNQEKITTVDTIEDFWQVYNYIEPASKLAQGCDYMVFKKGIQPDWEDFQNMSGGRWIVNSDRNIRGENLDTQWLEIIFILIGEHAGDYAHMVNGAVINIRPKGDKVCMWLKDASNMDGVMHIGRLIKSRLNLRDKDKIPFRVHREENKRARFGSQNSPGKIFI